MTNTGFALPPVPVPGLLIDQIGQEFSRYATKGTELLPTTGSSGEVISNPREIEAVPSGFSGQFQIEKIDAENHPDAASRCAVICSANGPVGAEIRKTEGHGQ